MTIPEYIAALKKNLARGDATEHTHRPALKALLESLSENIVATNEPKRIACGAPDFSISRKAVPLGHVECKQLPRNLMDGLLYARAAYCLSQLGANSRV
jgi:hypothetical protein